MSKTLVAAVAALALTGLAGQALADSAPAKVVKISTVNFQDAAAVNGLYAQLKRSAETVCDSNSANPRIAQADQLCVQRTLAQAVRSVNRPTLTALHDRGVGAPTSALAVQDH